MTLVNITFFVSYNKIKKNSYFMVMHINNFIVIGKKYIHIYINI